MTEPACSLCGRPIAGYDADLHHVELDDGKSAEICERCAPRLTEWQGRRMARLFPTRAMKKRRR